MTGQPPAASAPPVIACPFCAATETELLAAFGQFLLTSQYYCRRCRTVFEVVKGPAASADNSTDHLAEQRPTDPGR